jgi:spore coat polysaccharide biosynthesis protein SpsF (cytidylyltransferase family)
MKKYTVMNIRASAIIQARIGSSRLPGKVMENINGKPIIYYLLSRLSKSKLVEDIIVATSVNVENDRLCNYVNELGFKVYRGSEHNVLERFTEAARLCSNDTLLRITGDCPLIDPNIIDDLIGYYKKKLVEYAYLSPYFAEGVDCEVFDYNALLKAHKKSEKNSEKEHVTLFILNHPDQFKIAEMPNKKDNSKFRFTVDELSDLHVVKSIIKHFGEKIHDVRTSEIINYLTNHPEVRKLNSSIVRNEGLVKSLVLDTGIKNTDRIF